MAQITETRGVLAIICALFLLAGSGCSGPGQNQSTTIVPPVASETAPPEEAMAGTPTGVTERRVEPQILEIVERAIKSILDLEDPSDRADLLADAAVILATSGNRTRSAELFQSAIETANAIEASDTGDVSTKAYTLAAIGQSQAEAGAFEDALKTAVSLKEFKGPFVEDSQFEVLAWIAYNQAKLGSASAALAPANGIRDDYWKAFALTEIAVIQTHSEGLPVAAPTFEEAAAAARLVPSRSLMVAALAWVAGRIASVGEFDWARELIAEAIKIAGAEPDPGLRASALESIAEAQAECGDVEGVLQTVAAIRRCKLSRNLRGAASAAKRGNFALAFDVATSTTKPGWIILSTVAKSHSKSGDFQAALKTARSITDLAGQDIALGETVEALVAAGRLPEAYEICHTIHGAFRRARALMTVTSAHGKAGNAEAARRLLKEGQLVASTVDANYSENARIFREVAAAHARAGYVGEMLQWANEFTSAKARANVYLGLAEGLVGDE